MNLFKQRQPKRFNYTPRFHKEHVENKPPAFDPQWRGKIRKKRTIGLPILFVVLVMVIVIWFILSTYEV